VHSGIIREFISILICIFS